MTGSDNQAGNGSLVDNADFAGKFAGIGQLTKTGPLTWILSGTGNTVGSVSVTGGTLKFEQKGAFTTTGNYTTQSGAVTDTGTGSSVLAVGGKFASESGATLSVLIDDDVPEISARSAVLDGRLRLGGFTLKPVPVRASDIASRLYTLIHTTEGITGNFTNYNMAQPDLDYLLRDGHISSDGKDYNLGMRLAWTDGGLSQGTGSFTTEKGSAFDVDTVLSDQTVPAGVFASDWDGKSLIKSGEGLLVLSAANTYTGKTTVNGGVLRTDVADSFAHSSYVRVNDGILDLNGNNQQASRLAGSGGQILLSGATLTVSNTTQADSSSFAGDITDGMTPGGSVVKAGEGRLTLSGRTDWRGETRINGGELVLDGAGGGAQLAGDITGRHGTALSLHNGATLTGRADLADISIDRASTWNMTKDSRTENLRLAGNISVAGSGGPGKTLTTGNWYGQDGTVSLNTVLGDDNAVTDRIVVNGNTSGNTFVKVSNAGGHGAQTTEGIRVVEVRGQSAGTFTQTGRIVAGARDYSLVKKNADWYLTSLQGAPDKPSVSVVRPEAGDYTAGLVAANTMFITRLHDRPGETWYTDPLTGEKMATRLWLRQVGGHNDWKDRSEQLRTRSNRYVAQLGGGVAHWINGRQRLDLGVMGGYGHNSSNTRSGVTGYRSEGTVSGYSAGFYATWYQNDETKQGMYLDGWAQYGWFDNDVKGQDIGNESYKSGGLTTSLELGYTYKPGTLNEWYIRPQAQAIWMGVAADEHREDNGTRVSGKGDGNLQTRLGARTFLNVHSQQDAGKDRTFGPFVEVNWIHNTRDFGSRMDDVSIYQKGVRDLGEIQTGVEGQVSRHLGLWGNIGVRLGGNGYNDTSAVIGGKFSF